MDKKIYIIGTGTDGIATLTAQAAHAVEAADIIIGSSRVVKPFEKLGKEIFVSYDTDRITEFIDSSECRIIAVLMSGDCGFYSGADKLLEKLKKYSPQVICGISALVYFCSKIGIAWQDIKTVSLHGQENCSVRHICANKKTFFLLGGKVTPGDICKRLCEYNLENIRVYIGENLSYENERISSGRAADFAALETSNLCVMAVINPDYERYLKSSIPDDEFIRGDVPMTKSEVRGICVSRLEIGKKDICWDIGAGTGSVSVEMALRCADGMVYSVEMTAAGYMLIYQNRRKFGCDNIKIIQDTAENALDILPAPDCVFIGGSGEQLEKVILAALEKNSRAKIVVTAVSLETLGKSTQIFEKCGISAEITQIAVTRTKKLGTHTMLRAENPIFIIKGQKR